MSVRVQYEMNFNRTDRPDHDRNDDDVTVCRVESGDVHDGPNSKGVRQCSVAIDEVLAKCEATRSKPVRSAVFQTIVGSTPCATTWPFVIGPKRSRRGMAMITC